MTCLQIYQKLLSLATFLGVHSNPEELSCLSLQNTYLNWKITCHINLNFLLWTELLENLLLAKYLISVAVPLWKNLIIIKSIIVWEWKHLFTKNYFRQKKINYCYGFMPSDSQVICGPMVSENRGSPAQTKTPEKDHWCYTHTNIWWPHYQHKL